MGRQGERRCQLTGAVSLVVGAVLLTQCLNAGSLVWSMGYGILSFLALVLAMCAIDISRRNPADSLPAKGLASSYFMDVLLPAIGYLSYQGILKGMKDVKLSQQQVLKKILERHANTVYGKKYDFNGIKDREDFRTKVPLVGYSHFLPYTERIADGEESVLTVDKVEGLSTSSGTTGKSKLIPITEMFTKDISSNFIAQLYTLKRKSPTYNLGKLLMLAYKPFVRFGKTGIPIAPMMYHLSKHYHRANLAAPVLIMTSVDHEEAALYLHAVFGLAEKEVSDFNGAMSTLVHSFWKLVDLKWRDICTDIENGRLDGCPCLDRGIKEELVHCLEPNPERANELRKEFQVGMLGICLRVWPYCTSVTMLTTGGFAHHARILAEGPLKGVVQMSGAHSSSEGVIGINLYQGAGDTTYHLLINVVFLEFIPEARCDEPNPLTCFVDELEIGESYEVVLTTNLGLYRYRLGDVITIVSKTEQCPVYEFKHRLGQLLNLYYEKTPESVFYAALTKTASNLGIQVSDYTTCEDFVVRDIQENDCLSLISKKHYVLFVESTCLGEQKQLAENEEQFDKDLSEEFEIYNSLRKNGSIGTMRVIQVRSGTFLKVKARLIRDTQNPQFKMPRVMRRSEALEILINNRIN